MSVLRTLTLLLVLGALSPCQSPNLVRNGAADAQSGNDGYTFGPTAIPEWTVFNDATVTDYQMGALNLWPSPTDPGPVNRGRCYFSGGNGLSSALQQILDVSSVAAVIDTGQVQYDFAAWLGGYASQDDNALGQIVFRDAAATQISQVVIGPVLAVDRGFITSFLLRQATGTVPVGTRDIIVNVAFTRTAGTYCDGYCDNVTLILTPDPFVYTDPVATGVGSGTTGIPANAIEGGPYDYLVVDGSVGGLDRRVQTTVATPIRIEMFNPLLSQSNAPFALFAFVGVPMMGETVVLPYGWGIFAFPVEPITGPDPRTLVITDNAFATGLGVFPSVPATAPTPSTTAGTLPTTPGGWTLTIPPILLQPVTVSLQAAIFEGGTNIWLSNAVIVEVL